MAKASKKKSKGVDAFTLILVAGLILVTLVFLQVLREPAPAEPAPPATTSIPKPPQDDTLTATDLQAILDEQSVDACERIDSPLQQRAKDACYFNLAFEELDDTYCEKIVDDGMRAYCIQRVARRIERFKEIGRL